MKIQCEYCGSWIQDTDEKCPNCGATNSHLIRDNGKTPKTIEELKKWYQDRNLPPYEVTRFFIGVNYPDKRAFGIYEENGEFIVYKNKDDGTRAIRYKGKDEAYAVNELYLKLKSEILNQKSHQRAGSSPVSNRTNNARSKRKLGNIILQSISGFFIYVNLVSMFEKHWLSLLLLAAVPIVAYMIIQKKSLASNWKGLPKKIYDWGPKLFLPYFMLASFVVFCMNLDDVGAHYYNVDDAVYCKYDGDYYEYDSEYDNYIPISIEAIPPSVISNPEDYEFDYNNWEWDSSYEFEDSQYYEDNFKSDSSDWGSSDDSDYSWDSSDSWDSGGSDWGSDW